MSRVLNPERVPRSVIVIGASAGGVVALRELFAKLPGDLDPAIAVVLHRSPLMESSLTRVLGEASGARRRCRWALSRMSSPQLARGESAITATTTSS